MNYDYDDINQGYEESSGFSGFAFFAGLAVGAGLMFLMDPQAGRRRRTLIREKAVSYGNDITQYAGEKGRHLRSIAEGRMAEARNTIEQARQNLGNVPGIGEVVNRVSGGTANTGTGNTGTGNTGATSGNLGGTGSTGGFGANSGNSGDAGLDFPTGTRGR